MDPDSIPPGARIPNAACAARILTRLVSQKGGRP